MIKIFDLGKRLSYFILLVLIAAFVFSFYGKTFISPNKFLFSVSGDAIKNYYTYACHIKNDSSYINFEGMNYPYGEHFLYTDCHPVICTSVKYLSSFFPELPEYSIGVINFFMIFSFFITAVLLLYIFQMYKVNNIIGILGALGITVMAPQVFRMTGHISLSYSFFIPLTFILTLKSYTGANQKKWTALLMLHIIFWFFIHAYLGIMAVLFVFCFWLIQTLMNFRTAFNKFQTYYRLILWVIIPVLVFRSFVFITDTHTGRTTNPSGFFLHNAEPDDIVLPNHPPLKPLLDKLFFIDQEWEAWAYIGITSLIVILFILCNSLKNLFRSGIFVFNKKYLPDKNLRITVWASIILLIFAFGFPFKLFPALLDLFPVVKQFRATGRFDWLFFFAISIISMVILSNIAKLLLKKKHIFLAYSLIIIAPLLYFIEGISYHKETSGLVTMFPNLFHEKCLDNDFKSALNSIEPSKYQAIIPLPFYYIGSENFSRPVNNLSAKNSMIFSYHTSLPLCASYLTRTGISESKKIVQMISPDYYEKPIRYDLDSDKPFLIIRSSAELTKYEKQLLNKAVYLSGNPSLQLYEITYEKIFKNTGHKKIKLFDNKKDILFERQGFLVTDTTGYIYFNDFENLKSEIAFRSEGAFKGNKSDNIVIAEFKPATFKPEKEYIISAWMFNNQPDALNFWFRFIIEEYDMKADKWTVKFCLPEQSEVINEDWSLVEFRFSVSNTNSYVYVKTKGKELDKVKYYLDDLLVREKDNDVYKIINESDGRINELFKNNHRISWKL